MKAASKLKHQSMETHRPDMDSLEHRFPKISGIALVAANLIPLLGIFFAGWKAFDILVVFWLENAVFGFFNVLKVIWARDEATREVFSFWSMLVQKLFMIPFFILHYGGFMFLYGAFLFEALPTVFEDIDLSVDRRWFALTLAGMVISHGISFFTDYIGKREYSRTALGTLMVQPYVRIIVMHFAICLGGIPVMAYDSPTGFVVLLVIMKIGLDLFAHVRQHMKYAKAAAARQQSAEEEKDGM